MATFNGVDCDHYPGDQTMLLLRQHGQFHASGFYLAHRPNSQDNTWISRRQALASGGWGLIPTYAGYQKWEKNPDPFSVQAAQDHAGEAVHLMQAAGFASSSIAYLDLESGDTPDGAYADYVSAWIQGVAAGGFTPALYCSHLILPWAFTKTPIVWSFHIPENTEGVTYDPDNLPTGILDPRCVATQYRQNIELNGIPLSPEADSGGFDLSLSTVADPSNLAAVHAALAF
jgi:Domain of unknown function (DUF1906)